MDGFYSMKEMTFYYERITEKWKQCVKEKRNISSEEAIHLYHYTSTEVLDKILHNAAFWASNIFYLNDSSEFKAGIKAIREKVEKWKEEEPKRIVKGYLDEVEKYDGQNWQGIYSISFSTLYDKLQQWTTYAKESGVCIELDYNIIQDGLKSPRLLLKEKSANGKYIHASENYNGFGGLAYGDSGIGKNGRRKTEDALFRDFVKICRKLKWEDDKKTSEETQKIWIDREKEAKRYLSLAASYYKEQGFQGEGEVRISFFPLQERNALTGEMERAEIKYRQLKDGILRPYIEVYFFQGTDKTPRCPIKSITIGPSRKQQYVYDSVVHRLKYGQVNVWRYPLEERFEMLKQYIMACINFLSEEDEENMALVNEIYRRIVEQWCESCDDVTVEIKKREVKKQSRFLDLRGAKILFGVYDTSGESPSELENIRKKAENIIREFKKNEFLSKHGIWVKKSKNSYTY